MLVGVNRVSPVREKKGQWEAIRWVHVHLSLRDIGKINVNFFRNLARYVVLLVFCDLNLDWYHPGKLSTKLVILCYELDNHHK